MLSLIETKGAFVVLSPKWGTKGYQKKPELQFAKSCLL